MKKEHDIFQDVFIKEFLYNIQVNQKISIAEFLFTKKAFILFGVAGFLFWYNTGNINAQKYIAVGCILIFLYLFKNNRILKKEKYFISKDNNEKKLEMVFHMKLNQIIKNILKENYIKTLIVFCFFLPTFSYSSFSDSIEKSNNTQIENNDFYNGENQEFVDRAKLKMINYLIQEKKIFNFNQIIDYTKNESDILINKTKIINEKVKNEIQK